MEQFEWGGRVNNLTKAALASTLALFLTACTTTQQKVSAVLIWWAVAWKALHDHNTRSEPTAQAWPWGGAIL